jgi:2-phospho-L-lactate guanylyltransferase (CobY/MobA/RfbA family)
MLRLGTGPDDGRSFTFHYGQDSYAHHVDEAHRLGLDVATSFSAGTALDLDTPDDLQRVLRSEGSELDDLADIAPALRDIA